MANYYATARSNYFRVRDVEKFVIWADSLGLNYHQKDKFPGSSIAIFGDESGWPSTDIEGDRDVSVPDELQEHLADGEVAILMEVGSEAKRYLIGHALAIMRGKPIRSVHLDDIYKKAAEEFDVSSTDIGPCEY